MAEDEDEMEEPVSPEVLALLESWAASLRSTFPRYRWEVDGENGKVVGNLDLGDGILVHVQVEQEVEPDGDPGWIDASADLTEYRPPAPARQLVPQIGVKGIRGMDPTSPVRAVRVALRTLAERAKGYPVPGEGPRPA